MESTDPLNHPTEPPAGNPPSPAPLDDGTFLPPPTLSYASKPEARPRSRKSSIGLGYLSVWALGLFLLVVAGAMGARSFSAAAVLGIALLLALAIFRTVQDRNGAFILGIFFGIVTIVGGGFLLIAVGCGVFK